VCLTLSNETDLGLGRARPSLFLAGNTTSAGRNVTTYGMATLIHVAANTWFVSGTGVSAL
jgi:hypothetical protein